MRYLKVSKVKILESSFETFKSNSEFIEEVKNMIDDLLAYVNDDYDFTTEFNERSMILSLKFSNIVKWIDIKDSFINFYTILSETYHLETEGFIILAFTNGLGDFDINKGELMDHRIVEIEGEDNLEPLESIYRIKIKFDISKFLNTNQYNVLKK